MKNVNIDAMVKKLEELLKAEYAKTEIVEGNWRSGDESYHLRKITAPNNNDAIVIAEDVINERYMAQFSCTEGKLDLFFGFATKQRSTIRWRYYFDYEQDKYTQGCLDDWFLVERDKTSETMFSLIGDPGGHEGHYFHTIVNVE